MFSLKAENKFFGTAVMLASRVLLILQNCAMRSVMETTFTLGESSEDVLENVCFMVLGIKKRRANTKIGPTFTSFWFIYQTLYKCYSRSALFGHLLSSDTFFRALHFEPGRGPYDYFFFFL